MWNRCGCDAATPTAEWDGAGVAVFCRSCKYFFTIQIETKLNKQEAWKSIYIGAHGSSGGEQLVEIHFKQASDSCLSDSFQLRPHPQCCWFSCPPRVRLLTHFTFTSHTLHLADKHCCFSQSRLDRLPCLTIYKMLLDICSPDAVARFKT